MPLSVSDAIQRVIRASCQVLHTRFIAWTTPPRHGLVRGLVSDLARGKGDLVAENALVRQQLIVLSWQVKRPALTRLDRLLLLLLAARVPTWKQTLTLVQPDTLLHWHRQGFRLIWTARSARPAAQPRSPDDTRRVIRTMAPENPLGGAERIRGALFTLGIRVNKRTVQTSMRQARPPQQRSQSWATVLHNHGHQISRLRRSPDQRPLVPVARRVLHD